jgi:hypothetical protein
VKLIEEKVGFEKKKSKRGKFTERGMEMMMDKQQQQQLAVRQRQCDMEVMKMAMLKHEETFRQQVIKPRNVHLSFISMAKLFRLVCDLIYEPVLIIESCSRSYRSMSCTGCTASRGS